MAPVLRQAIDLLEGIAHHLAVPAPDRLVELVGEDGQAPGRGAGGAARGFVRGRTHRALVCLRAQPCRQRGLRLPDLLELALEGALPAPGRLELAGEPGDLAGGPRLELGAQRVALAEQAVALGLEALARILRGAHLAPGGR